jgi:hypothetical protein
VAINLEADAAALYELAQADAAYARWTWADAGSPLMLASGHGGVHPLRKALVEADDRVARRARDLAGLTLRRARRGRPLGANRRRPPQTPRNVKAALVAHQRRVAYAWPPGTLPRQVRLRTVGAMVVRRRVGRSTAPPPARTAPDRFGTA